MTREPKKDRPPWIPPLKPQTAFKTQILKPWCPRSSYWTKFGETIPWFVGYRVSRVSRVSRVDIRFGGAICSLCPADAAWWHSFGALEVLEAREPPRNFNALIASNEENLCIGRQEGSPSKPSTLSNLTASLQSRMPSQKPSYGPRSPRKCSTKAGTRLWQAARGGEASGLQDVQCFRRPCVCLCVSVSLCVCVCVFVFALGGGGGGVHLLRCPA